MGTEDKAANKGQDAKGKAKEAAGKATGNAKLEGEGKNDQKAAAAKDAGERAKDAFKK